MVLLPGILSMTYINLLMKTHRNVRAKSPEAVRNIRSVIPKKLSSSIEAMVAVRHDNGPRLVSGRE